MKPLNKTRKSRINNSLAFGHFMFEFLFHCSNWLARFCFVQSSVLFYLTSIDLNLQLCECKSNYIRINGFTAIIKIIADIFLKQILLIPRFQFAPLTNWTMCVVYAPIINIVDTLSCNPTTRSLHLKIAIKLHIDRTAILHWFHYFRTITSK